MKTLYLECNMGAAGDMLMGALLELLPDPDSFLKTMNSLGLPGVLVSAQKTQQCGITGTHMSVLIDGKEEHQHMHAQEHTHHHECDDKHHHAHEHTHPHSHSHKTQAQIAHIISHLPISDKVKKDANSVYRLIADAESAAHGVPAEQIHFHEVGELDAVADIVGVCLLFDMLSPDRIVASPINTGSGQVRTAHGILPVPAPATAHLLKGIPVFSGTIQAELCTPTGAALLKHFADAFSPMPAMTVLNTGYGMGTKEFEAANCVRAFWGETQSTADEVIACLTCNLDDMTPEAIGFAQEQLMQSGALDVFTTPIQMKKGRPAVMLTCLCPQNMADTFAKLMLTHTTTFGVRKSECTRYTLSPTFSTVQTPYGSCTVKTGVGYGITKSKPEYEDVAKCAKMHGIAFQTVYDAVKKAAD